MGTIGPYVAIANPLFELMEFHEQQIESELTESESNESKLCDFVNEQSANVNKNKCAKKEKSKSSVSFRSKENYKDSRHCNCKSKSANVFR